MMKPLFILLLLALVAPASAVIVSFDNATCGIHIEKDIQTSADGRLQINTSDFPETNCSMFVSTNEFTNTPNSYNPSGSKVTYSDEYYTVKILADDHTNDGFSWESHNTKWLGNIFYELRRQTILMEKQNELLEEQNKLVKAQMGMKLKCTTTGVGVCREFSWVTE